MASENTSSFNNTNMSTDHVNSSYFSDTNSSAPRTTFLALFIVVSFVGNTCVVIVILPNKKYRRVALNLIILNMAVLNIYDSLVNMPVVMGSLLSSNWIFDKLLCQFNTFSMNLVVVETILTVLVLIIDRFIAIIVTAKKYRKLLTCSKLMLMIAYTWMQSAGFSLPFLIGAVPSTFRNQLNLCSISDYSSLLFICFASVFCFLIPTIVIFILFILMFKYVYKKRFAIRAKLAHQNYSALNNEQPQLLKDIAMAKYAGILFVVWFIFECPYIVTTYIKQFQYNIESKDDPSISPFDYSWLVDVTFLFVRFLFSSVLPILTFLWRKDFWQSWKDTVFCRRSNSVTDVDTLSGAAITPNLDKKDEEDKISDVPSLRSKERVKVESSSALSFNIPVLFATSSGIHVETNTSESDIFYTELETSRSDEPNVVKGKKLDVVSSLEYIPPDTSDYDSNSDTDQYSVSQPVSIAHLENRVIDTSTRSSSQPQVQNIVDMEEKGRQFKSENIAAVYCTDSGLDLTSIHKSCDVNCSVEGDCNHGNWHTGSSADGSSVGEYNHGNCPGSSSVSSSTGGECDTDSHAALIIAANSENEQRFRLDSLEHNDTNCHFNRTFSKADAYIVGDTYSILPYACIQKRTISNVKQETVMAGFEQEEDSFHNRSSDSCNKPNCYEVTEHNPSDRKVHCEVKNLVHKPPLKLKMNPLLSSQNFDKQTKRTLKEIPNVSGPTCGSSSGDFEDRLAEQCTKTIIEDNNHSSITGGNDTYKSSKPVSNIEQATENPYPPRQSRGKKRKKHRRQRTADSQKALLGSGSSSELHEMKSALVNNTQNADNRPTLDSLFQQDNQDGYSDQRKNPINGNTTDNSEWKLPVTRNAVFKKCEH